MGCNAHNHRPGCDCGWGGVFYGLGLRDGANYWSKAESYTNPNARCPRCSALVYFYRSPDGGGVYFDDLGPPWPKHPCMDSSGRSLKVERPRTQRATPMWAAAGWHPLLCESMDVYKQDVKIIILTTGSGEDQRQLFAKRPNATIDARSPILWRRKGESKGHYELSTLDLSHSGFKEIQFDAFDALKALEKNLHIERLGAEAPFFLERMNASKRELLKGYPIPGLSAKLDSLIGSFHQRLLDHGEIAEIEELALGSLKNCVEAELRLQEIRHRNQALHAELSAEGVRMMQEFAVSGLDLRKTLSRARQRAVSNGVSLEEGRVLMRAAVQNVVNAGNQTAETERKRLLLTPFLNVLIASSSLFGSKAKHLLQNTMQRSVQRGQDVDLIKEQLLRQAREYLEECAKKMALEQEKRRGDEARADLISRCIDDAIERFPPIDRYLVTSALARITNRNTSIEKVKAAIDAIAQKWQAGYLKRMKPRPLKPKGARGQVNPSNPRNANERAPRNPPNDRVQLTESPRQPFNSSMAQELGRLLAAMEKTG